RFKDALEYSAAALVIGLLGGWLDVITWGKPFYAFYKYVKFNLKGSAKRFGAYPWSYYFKVAWNVSGPGCVVIAVGLLASLRRHTKLALLVIGYVLVHCAIPHKEFRFLMPVAPLAFALSGAGLAELFVRARREAIGVAVALACAGMALYTPYLTWASLGFPSDRGTRSPWHSGEGINRLLWSLGETPDVCGVIVTGESFGWIGGYSYFHRDVNLYPGASDGERAAANYLIAHRNTPPSAGYRPIDQSRKYVLYRREGGCAPAPADYKRELP
ncbi:MAG TPA: hypothetical protein VGI70_04730, partial [Polyangiales bacterium]